MAYQSWYWLFIYMINFKIKCFVLIAALHPIISLHDIKVIISVSLLRSRALELNDIVKILHPFV